MSRPRRLVHLLTCSLAVLIGIIPQGLYTPAAAGERSHRPGEILVKYRHAQPERTQARLTAKYGLSRLHHFRHLGIHHLKVPEGAVVKDLVRKLRQEKDVEYAEPNFRRRPLTVIPNDPKWVEQDFYLRKIGTPDLWSTTQGSASVVVAVLDTGVDHTHPDLTANLWVNPNEVPANLVDDDGNLCVDDIRGWDFCVTYDAASGECIGEDADPTDSQGHGTAMAGIIGGAGNNGVGITGVNWRVGLMPVKFMNSEGDVASEIRAINYAVRTGARVINASFGECGDISNPDPEEIGFSAAEYDAIKSAGDQGVLVVAAAGNGCVNGAGQMVYDNDSPVRTFPASYVLDHTVDGTFYPALNNIITVAASNEDDGLAYFSGFGAASVHLAAPGDLVYTTRLGGGYGSSSGTSAATAFVSGAAALLWSAQPDATAPQIRNAIQNGVDQVGGLAQKTVTGGRLNISRAFQSMEILSLKRGWNFVSFCRTPPNPEPGEILQSEAPKVIVVWGYDNASKTWKRWAPNPAPGFVNTLFAMEPGEGYWILMDSDGTVDLSSWAPMADPKVRLHPGWNLVGYNGTQDQTLQEGLGAAADKVSVAWSWKSGEWQVGLLDFEPPLPMATLINFEKKRAYWLKVNTEEAFDWGQH